MVTLSAHFDGKAIVLDEPSSLPLRAGTRLKVNVEVVEEASSQTAPRRFQPLNVQIDPAMSKSIAADPEFNIEDT